MTKKNNVLTDKQAKALTNLVEARVHQQKVEALVRDACANAGVPLLSYESADHLVRHVLSPISK